MRRLKNWLPRVAEEMEAREAARTLEPLNENGDEQEGGNGGNGGNGNGGNGGNGNGGNGENGNGGNGHRNGNHGMNYGGFMPVARECTFQDFLKCKPQNFSGTEGVVGLTRWFEKMETVFNISNCPPKYQVKYATCTLQDSALTWWNSHKRTIGVEAAYAMNWVELMKLMTENGPLIEENQKKVERFIGGLPDNIQGNVIAANPARLQDAIRIANQLMDKKVQGYAARSAENKRRMESNLRDNRGQQPPFKRQNTSGQNVARAYTAGNNERKGYAGPLPYCNKCRLHHEGLCTMRYGNYKKVGHQTRDCRAAIAPNTQRAPVGNQQVEESEPWKPNKKQEWKQRLGNQTAVRSYVESLTPLVENQSILRKDVKFIWHKLRPRKLRISRRRGDLRTYRSYGNFRKSFRLAEPDVQVPLDEIEIDENLRFVEEPIEIVERDVKKLKRRRIPLVKVRWNSRQGAEYTWEHEDQFRKKYPHLFSETVPPSGVAT
ncbi:hypothetical protein Tco_0490634 [Tanacetum coccineum]